MINNAIPERGWYSSSYSQNNGGECVLIHLGYAATHEAVPVRDSKVPDGPVLMVGRSAYRGLLELARRG